jgi:hypothetical protein
MTIISIKPNKIVTKYKLRMNKPVAGFSKLSKGKIN